MKNYTAPECGYFIQSDKIVTDGTHKCSKISGTSLGALVGCNPYITPFMASAKMLGLWDEDISDRPAVKAGVVLEPKIIDYLSKNFQSFGTFIPAEDMYDAREGEHGKWKSDFDDPAFSGHVDGIVTCDGKDYILEVKTTSRRNVENGAWLTKPPEHYLWQVYLYNHFITKQDKAYFALGIVEDSDYADPYAWEPHRNNCYLIEIEIDQHQVECMINAMRNVYKEISKGHTLRFTDDPKDVELLTHLRDLNGSTDDLIKMVSEYNAVRDEIKSVMDSIKEKTDREKELADRIKSIMVTKNISKADNVAIQRRVTRTFDWDKAKAEAFDVSRYTKEKTSYAITAKKKE